MRKNLSAIVLVMFSACSLSAESARGQEIGDSEEEEIQVITVTGRRQPLRDLAGNVGLLTRGDLEFVRHDHISEAINRVAGAMIQRGSGQEHLTAIRSPVLTAGAGAGSFLFLEDGIPLRAAGFANVNGLFEANTEQAGRIEVIRGPASALYGSNAIHGLVNVLSAAPTQGLERRVDLSIGPHAFLHARASVSATTGNQGYRISAQQAHDGGYRADSGFNQQKATLRHDFEAGGDKVTTVLSIHNLDQETAGFITGLNAFKDKKIAKSNPNPEAFRDSQSVRLYLRWRRKLSDTREFSVTPYLRYTDMKFRMHFLPSRALEENSHKSAGVQAQYTLLLGQGGGGDSRGHRVIFGLDGEVTSGGLRETQTITTPVPGFLPGVHYDYHINAVMLAPYLHAEWRLGPRTLLTTGLRFEHMRYDYNNRTDSDIFGRFQRVSNRVDSFNNATPKIGLSHRLGAAATVYLNLARAARAPQTTDLYRLQSRQVIGEVKSERMDSAEVGLRGGWGGASYGLSFYYMEKRNFFFRDVDGFNVADGKTRHRGVEVELRAPLGHGFEFATDFSVARHTYDFTNQVSSVSNSTEAIKKGDDVDTAPRTLGNLRLTWRNDQGFRTELEWAHVGGYYMDAANLHRYPGHDLLNLRAQLNLGEFLTVHGRITNLTDRAFAKRADFFLGTNRYFPGEGRAVHIAVGARF